MPVQAGTMPRQSQSELNAAFDLKIVLGVLLWGQRQLSDKLIIYS